jgi:hypothetical protein
MATLLPPEPGDEIPSSAERRLFALFAQLPDAWTVLHSVGIARHRRKRWAEADFVLVGPTGLYVVEVKGGRVAREEGTWIFTDRYDRDSTKQEGPFEQAGGAAGALQSYLRSRRKVTRSLPDVEVGWAVMLPDVSFNVDGPDIEPEVLYDARHAGAGITAFLDRVADYWSKRWGKAIPTLSPGERSALVQVIRPDFDVRPSLRHRADRINDELLRLTEEQYNILDGLSENERVIIRGSAGTGKTLLGVEEARRQAREGRRVLLTCFNRALSDYLERACSDIAGIEVRNFHRVLHDLIIEAGLERELPDASIPDLLAVFYPAAALEALDLLGESNRYDVLIVDEAQDLLVADYASVMDKLLEGGLRGGTWRVFVDSSQDLFTGLDRDTLRHLLEGGCASYRLSLNCRNTEQIATTTAMLSGTKLTPALVQGPEVDVVFCRDHGDLRRQVAKAINRLLSERIEPQNMVVLSPVHLSNSGLARALPELRLHLVDVSELYGPTIPTNTYIAYRTIGSFKGLEADVVLLVDFQDLERLETRVATYVGGSRARVILKAFLPMSVEVGYLKRAMEFGRLQAEERGES